MQRATVAIALSLGLLACQAKAPSSTSTDDKKGVAADKTATAQKGAAEPMKQPPGVPAPADVAAAPADAQKTATGLASKVLTAGKGADKPRAFDKVKVHYTGWTTDGKMFDSSVTRGEPAEFPLNQVIAGWTEGLQLMTIGEKRRFWIPESIAYQGQPGAPAGTLVFDVELLEINKMPDPPKVPADVAAAPANAQKTKSGLASTVVTKGTGKDHPKAEDKVTVHYTGWTTDGKMFDSSVTRGEAATFPLNRVIPGWTEGVQLMVEGEKRRFWIPEELAYKGRPGPQGTLVFDVELVSIAKTPEAPVTPKDVAAAPKDAKKTASGLAYKTLKAGTGKVHPTASTVVQVHYSGWTTDGKMFDSSVSRGEPSEFPLNGVIPGWTEGVQLMVEGEKVRFWIPDELAYKGKPGRPQGMLVFDIELIKIKG